MHPSGKRTFEKLLGSLNLTPDQYNAIIRAVADLESAPPRLDDERVRLVAQKVAEKMVADFKANFPAAKLPGVEEKFKKVALEIAVGLVTSGIWGILSYLANTQGLHFASAGEDWKNEDAMRRANFASSHSIGQDSLETLGREGFLLYCVRNEYLSGVTEQLKDNPDLKPIADLILKDVGWEERSFNVFFYEALTKGVAGGLLA